MLPIGFPDKITDYEGNIVQVRVWLVRACTHARASVCLSAGLLSPARAHALLWRLFI